MKTQSGVARLDRLVGQALVRAGFSVSGITLVVAVSGGPDSSALLHSLHRLSGQHQINLHVAHLHHDIRGEESDQDAQFVANLAHQLGLAVTTVSGRAWGTPWLGSNGCGAMAPPPRPSRSSAS